MNDNLQILNTKVMFDLIGDDKALIRKFKIEFLQQAKKSIKEISAAYSENAFEQIKKETHFLKTSAKAIGAEVTADYLQQLEDKSLLEDKEQCKQLIILLNHSVKQVYGEIKNES